ncbi:hypothetical protein AAG906_003130 [Vitis piasezkii]
MAESFLSSIKLAWHGVPKRVKRLENVLATIKAVLVDAEEKLWKDQQLHDWLGNLKQVLVSHGSIKRKVLLFFSSSNLIPFSFKMANKNNFNLVSDVKRAPMVYRETTHSFVLASDVIGRDKDKEKVLELLMNSSDDDERISVIPIVGLGGLGKTTLAKLVYNDQWVVGHFKKRIWVCVSNDFDMKKVIIDIINSIKTTVEGGSGTGLLKYNELNLEQSQTVLRTTLGNENFFLVLDDMWNEDRQKWIELETLLKNGAKGNKIVVTTRGHSVASIMGTVPAYILEGLPHVDCLSVFLKWAFNEGQEKQHPNLVKIGDDIVKKCNGVPLAARTLGSLLFSKFEPRDWLYVRDNDIWKLEQKEGDILPALRLSYEQLPSYLKCCFAYCSIFPKNHVFYNEELVYMWEAQGLIEPSKKKQELDDIGNRYIKEMLSRSFFQDFEDHQFPTVSRMVRHVSFSYDLDEKEILSVVGELNDIRTIYFPFKLKTSRGEPFLKACISKFKCIKMLDLSNSNFDTLPNSISNLKHLKFLDLSGNKRIKKLPNTVCKILLQGTKSHRLRSLVIRGCRSLETLAPSMKQAPSLERLVILDCEGLIPLDGNGKTTFGLGNLRVLWLIKLPKLEALPEWMRNLTSLDRLAIEECPQLTERCKKTTGEDWHKISHVSKIYIDGVKTPKN